jgi:cell division protein FtsB
MDLRLGPPRVRILPHAGEGFRAVFDRTTGQAFKRTLGQAIDQAKGQANDRVPKAEAMAARWVEHTRPVWSWLAQEWRRLGTAAALLLIGGLLLHAMFGANGMVIYGQKRAEMQALQKDVERLQKENGLHVEQIKSLKSDPAAIEKEAREQLHYTRPGEVVLVSPDAARNQPTSRAGNDK